MTPPPTDTTPFTFRTRLHADDELRVRRIADATGFFRPDEVDVACELVRDRLAHGPLSGYEFVLADGADGNLIGYACFGPIACTIGGVDLYWIIVEPAAQGKGLGRAIMAEVEHRATESGGRRIYIETSSLPKYAPTQRFYGRCGYALEARLPDFYQPGDDKLIYCKSLQTDRS